MAEEHNILRVEGVSKRYGGLQALDSVSLSIRYGETHALIGENGAGKSTLMKILGGIEKKDEGSFFFDGAPAEFHGPRHALSAGIAIIHQELSMLPDLDIIENVYMGRMASRRGKVDWKTLEAKTREQLCRVGLSLDTRTPVKALSMSQKQLVEIAKALSVNAKLIIMDEPTSSLCDAEVERLFRVIEDLHREGIAVIYISHKLKEVLHVADRVSALRDGRFVGTVSAAGATTDTLVQMMVGRDLDRHHVERREPGPVRLRVTGFSGSKFSDVAFDLREGEILGFSGLVGAGRTEVARALFGADPHSSGSVELDGRPYIPSSPDKAISAGIAMVAEDRKNQSLFLNLPIRFNMSMAKLPRLARWGRVQERQVDAIVQDFKARLNIKMKNPDDPVKSLSGGNQQKTILARWLSTDPKVLILDEPTHGIDVGAKAEIYKLIRELARSGMSIILISSELAEIIALSDRVLVMHGGRARAMLPWDALTEESIMRCATGNDPEDPALSCEG